MEKDKEAKFVLRLPQDLKEKTEKKAKNGNRSLNGHIVTVLQEDLKKDKK